MSPGDSLSDARLSNLVDAARLAEPPGARYRILEELGRGGMGTVYLADDDALDRRVALKVLAAHPEPGLAERMRREARVLAELEHPGIVPIHDAGVLPDGRLYYAMKLVRGQRLDDFCAARPPLAELLRVFQRVCEPVAFAHANGVVHRDLKPQNIMVGEFGEVLVLDWGVARLLHRPDSPPGSAARDAVDTAHGAVIGTPGYMSPEQAAGDIDAIDSRADIYSLGKLLEFLLAHAAPPARPSKQLRAMCAKATADAPAARYASAIDLSFDAGRCLEGRPVSAYRENAAERVWRFLNRNKTVTGLVLAYILMRALLIFFRPR